MKKIIVFAAALAALVSCNKSVIVSSVEADEPGFISLGISTSDVMVETKALAANTSLAGYNITLIDNDTPSKPLWTKEYADAQAESVWKVAPGTYTIKVENKTMDEVYPDNTSAGEVRIAGQTDDVTVTAGKTSTCTVNCQPVNAKVSFCATSDFLSIFSAPSVSVTDGTRTVNLGTVEATLGSAAFYNPGEITWNLTATVDGKSKNYSGKLTLVAKQWSKVTFGTSSTNGVIGITINVNGEMTSENETVEVDPWNPLQ